MASKKPVFINNHFYHIYNRGVEKRSLFSKDSDYFRFIHDLYEFNDSKPAPTTNRGATSIDRKRDLLVEIVSFSLMPNHFHLILKQLKKDGISQFMKKLGTGYAMYFNEKYDRVGSLFQGRFKAIHIQKDEYLLHLSRYVHLNPIELVEENWQKDGIKNWSRVKKFLEHYRWSSYLDYIGIKNFPSVTSRSFLLEYFKNSKDYQNFIESFVIQDLDLIKIQGLTLEG